MLQPISRTQGVLPPHLIWPHGHEEEPGRTSPTEMAAEPDFSRPLGNAQATMRKIAAAVARAAAELPKPQPIETVPRGAKLDFQA